MHKILIIFKLTRLIRIRLFLSIELFRKSWLYFVEKYIGCIRKLSYVQNV